MSPRTTLVRAPARLDPVILERARALRRWTTTAPRHEELVVPDGTVPVSVPEEEVRDYAVALVGELGVNGTARALGCSDRLVRDAARQATQ